ncbi:MAG: 4Fe-4S dicluster domain-containing protein [bacterium]
MPTRVRWLSGQALDRVLDRLARESELIAPVEVEDELLFLPVQGSAEICRDYVNSLVPPKEYFLPSPERLVSYRLENGTPTLENAGSRVPRDRVLFGIRSCDVAGVAYLERFLSGVIFGRPDTADGPFLERREATTLISVVCQEPGETCMCVCCEGGPALESGYDWQLTELSGGWLVEIGSERGERLAQRCVAELLDPPAGAIEEKQSRVRATVEHFKEHSAHRVQTMAASRMISTGRLDESFWTIVGARCLECGGCAFVCPTCYCFHVADVNGPGEAAFEEPAGGFMPAAPGGITGDVRDGRWDRIRTRDCCTLSGYVRQAGGGYPRFTCGERCLTRFFHKLSAQFQQRMETLGCTGCGRCIQVCMGEEGIDRIAEGMRDALTGRGRGSLSAPLAGAGPEVAAGTGKE